jgi:hypothetical protein
VIPAKDRPAYGNIGPDGRFQLTTYDLNDGCVYGKHPVTIISNDPVSNNAMKWLVPKQYASLKTSGLEIEINGPRDDVEIHLTWKDSGHDKPYIERINSE